MASLNHHDLQFILKQIKISEAHANGTPLTDLIDNPLLPYGVRTVDGSWNNLEPGREYWGAADQPFPNMLDRDYINENDGDAFDPDGPFGPSPAVTNNDYSQPGNVADADPRIISNLIVDQSSGNAAALITALQQAGSTDPIAHAQEVATLDNAYKQAKAAADAAAAAQASAQSIADVAEGALTEAGAAYDAASLAVFQAISDWLEGDISDEELDQFYVQEALAFDAFSASQLVFNAALDVLDGANSANTSATAALDAAEGVFLEAVEAHGLNYENGTWVIENEAPDDGISAPFNSWMTLFGQFFDHGLDLVEKGNNGTVYIPLQPDDPLYVEGGHANFMVVTRTTASPGADGVFGTADDIRPKNLTTPFVDQNQTYTSHASHQVFLREYVLDAEGRPIATGNLLNGQNGGLPTWADIKLQALEKLGIRLTDADVSNIPLLATDQYGNFIPGENGLPQIVMPGTPPVLLEGTLDGGTATTGAVRTGHAFLDDIAHNAAPVFAGGQLVPDADDVTGNDVPVNNRGQNLAYDDELLDQHYITGDGRGNENIGLTAVHHVFHAEHNRQVAEIKQTLIDAGDAAFLNEWYLKDGSGNVVLDGAGNPVWDGERLFQAARFATEMQYQHLAFEEFARKIQPDIDLFVFNAMADIDPSIMGEFADVVYRFGHSMLRDTVDLVQLDDNGNLMQTEVGLIQAFLNPLLYAEQGTSEEAAGAIVHGMTRQVGSEIDEFVTGTLRNNLLGLPLDLATINIARARENGVPSLQKAREQFYELTGDTQLKPYDNWTDFAYHLKNPASIINFIAAYGKHETVADADTLAAKRDAAALLVFGGTDAPADRLDFLNSTGSWANQESGLNQVDLWIGGLAEKKMSFGGMLGSTFSFVFEVTLENLQNGDRFYYLSRTQGLNFLNELEANSFAKMIMANTSLGDTAAHGHLPGDIFSTPNYILEMNEAVQIGADPVGDDPHLEAMAPLVVRKDLDGDGDWDYLQYRGADHVVLGGTEEDDILIAGDGDDTVWGDGGDDYIEVGYGVDHAHGGAGDDIIVNAGTDIGETDMLHGDEGNDVIHGGSGLALIFGGDGNDFISAGKDGKEVFGGEGNDFILGGEGLDFLMGNEGDDWIEAGNGFDTTAGDNSELFFNSTVIGHDVMFAGQNEHDFDAESGDDIMVQGESVMRNNGMAGFDWAIHKGSSKGADSDMNVPIFTNQPEFILRDRFDLVEGLSGWVHDDVLYGREVVLGAIGPDGGAAIPDPNAPLESYSNDLYEASLRRIDGFRELVGHLEWDENDPTALVMRTDDATDILLGGGGSDTFMGRAGNDIIDGDAWLNVRISVRDKNDPSVELFSVDSLTEIQDRLFSREINPGQLQIVREILHAEQDASVDVAIYRDVMANYLISQNADGSISVAHVDGDQSDGVDTLRNIEELHFVDGIHKFNRAPTGTPTISDSTPTKGQLLTVSLASLTDWDGINPDAVSYQWQAGVNGIFQNIVGANGMSFTPTDAELDKQLRVIVRYTDNRGADEEVTSLPTELVGSINQIIGDDTANVLVGTEVSDDIQALGGDDMIIGSAGADRIDGGTGVDTVSYAAALSGINVALWEGRASNDGHGSSDVLSGIENIIGSAFNDSIAGDTGNNRLEGGAGNDYLAGGAGDDILIGGAGNDTLVGGAGIDTASYAASASGINVALWEGRASNDGHGSSDVLSGIENIIGSAFNDSIAGDTGNNRLEGGAGNDYLAGGAGDDILIGGTGNDTLVGGAGIDTASYAASASGINVALWEGRASNDGHGSSDVLSGIENIIGSAFNDSIAGDTGNNRLEGGAGNDYLAGGAGDDILIGGTGNDTLVGGIGNDIFVFTESFGHDVIRDFTEGGAGGRDMIDISGLGITSASFATEVVISDSGADTLVTIGSNSIRLIGIDDASTITANDFMLVA